MATRTPKARDRKAPNVKKKAPKRVKLKPSAKHALAKAREVETLLARDVADDDLLVRNISTEMLAQQDPHSRALAILSATQQTSAAEQLAYGAFLDLLDADKVQVVREDDGTVWMFVPNQPSPGRWRGVLRERDGAVERSWFLPDEGKIVWEKI